MKNIIWQQPSGQIAVHNLPDSADSQAAAVELLSSGSVDAGWTAVLFDVQEFPGPPQETWVIINSVLTTDEGAMAVWLVEEKKRVGRAIIDDLERKHLMPKMLRVSLIQDAEERAIAYGAAQVPPWPPLESVTVLRANDPESGYNQVRELHNHIDQVRVEHGQ